MKQYVWLLVVLGLLFLPSVDALSYYQSRCFVLANGMPCLNSSSGQTILEGAKINWSDILNTQSGGADGNNYTVTCSISGTTTKTAQCSRAGWSNYSYTWTDLDTDTNTENATWNETRGNAIYYLRTDGLLDNQTWNQTKANTLYAPISTISDNTTWNQTYANTLYAAITTVSDNQTWNETKADAKYYLLSNPWGYYNGSTALTTVEKLWHGNSTLYLTIASYNTNAYGFYNGSTAPATLDPLWSGNRTLVCYSNGTGCPASSGDNSSWNETKANTLYAPISTVSDNTSWNQTKANTLYAPISTVSDNQTWNETRANALYLTSYTETDPFYNRTFNHTWVLGLNYITDGNTNWDNSYGFITTSGELDQLWSGNRTLVCYSNGTGCPASSGDNSSWNQTGANLLYVRNDTIPTCTGTDKLTSAGNGVFTCAPDQTSVGGGDPNYGGGWTNTSGSGNISLTNTAVNVSAKTLFIDNTNGRISVTGDVNVSGAVQSTSLGVGRVPSTTLVDFFSAASGTDIMVLRNNADAADLTFDTLNAINRIKGGAGDGVMFGTAAQDYLLYIASTGFVGIGSSAPREKLDVNGSAIINGTLNVTGRANFTGDVYVQGSPVCTSATGCGGTLTHWVNKTTVITQGNGTTLQNITGLEWVALANQNYSMDCTLYYDSNLTTNGLSLALDDYGNAVSTARWGASIFTVSTTTVNSGTIGALGTTKVTSTAVQTANSVYIAKMWATINNGASDVIITPQVSAEIAGSRSTINLNSVCHVETI